MISDLDLEMYPAPADSLTVEQFTDRVHGRYEAVVNYGEINSWTASRLLDDWRRLDPLETTQGDVRQSQLLHTALISGSLICDEVIRSGNRQQSKKARYLKSALILDSCQVRLGIPGHDISDIPSKLENAIEVLPARKKESASDDVRRLSIRSVHAYASANIHERRGGNTSLMNAALGSVVCDAVSRTDEIYRMYADEPRHGRRLQYQGGLVEVMYFAYRVADIYTRNAVAKEYVRFASEREDSPFVCVRGSNGLRRSFDVVVADESGTRELIQVKSGSTHPYAPGIDLWYSKDGLVANIPEVIESFRGVIGGIGDTKMQSMSILRDFFATKACVSA